MAVLVSCKIVYRFPGSFAVWTVDDLGVVAFLSPKTANASADAGKMEYRAVCRYVRSKNLSPCVEWTKESQRSSVSTQEEDVLVQNKSVCPTKEMTGKKAS